MSYCYLKRESVCRHLRLGYRQSFRIVGASYGERISSADVLAVLNRSRRAIENPLDCIPSDLMTPEETAAHYAGSEISTRELKAWIHRKNPENIPPHFRVNKHTVRFSAALLDGWLASRSRIKRHS